MSLPTSGRSRPLVAAALLGVAGCQIVGAYKEFQPGSPRDPHPCDVFTKRTQAAPGERVQVLVDAPDGKCFWIDRTEVTVAQYGQWLKENPDFDFAPFDRRHCDWKPRGASNPSSDVGDTCAANIDPRRERDPWGSSKPMRCVDWCDASAFCHTNGGRLCWEQPPQFGTFDGAGKTAEWSRACSSEGTRPFTWGSDLVGATNCNVDQAKYGCRGGPNDLAYACGPALAGAFHACVTVQGVFDLIGNVSEWMGACAIGQDDAGTGSPDLPCMVRGGGFGTAVADIGCSAQASYPARKARQADVGFRCCADLSAGDQAVLISQSTSADLRSAPR